MDSTSLLERPKPDSNDFSDLFEGALDGLERFHMMMAAWEMGLFDLTASPRTSGELSAESGCLEVMMSLLCDGLVEVGLLERVDDRWVNTPLARAYLQGSSPLTMRNTLENMREVAKRWGRLGEVLRNGPFMMDRTEVFGDRWLISIAEWSRAGAVQSALAAVQENSDVDRWKRMLDLGGGHGLYSIAFTALNPGLEAWVFDLPGVVHLTQRYIQEYGSERVHSIAGDFFKDDIGHGYDVIFSSFNQSGSEAELIPMLYRALSPGGELVLRRHKDKAREGAVKILDWNLVGFEGKKLGAKRFSSNRIMPRDDYLRALEEEGFQNIRTVPVDDMSEMIFASKPSEEGSDR